MSLCRLLVVLNNQQDRLYQLDHREYQRWNLAKLLKLRQKEQFRPAILAVSLVSQNRF